MSFLTPCFNTYKICYGSIVTDSEPILTFFIKPFTTKIILPAIIGDYKVFAVNFNGIKTFLGETKESDGIFSFPKTLPENLKSDKFNYEKNIGLFNIYEVHNINRLDIVPENNNWKKWIHSLRLQDIYLDNFKYEPDGTIYVYALAVNKNPIKQDDNVSMFWSD